MTQIITNHDFTNGTTGWTNSGGAFSGNNQPAVTSNVLRFTYQERTVSQEAAISDISQIDRFEIDLSMAKHSAKTSAQVFVYYLLLFRNASNQTVATVRSPASGNHTDLENTFKSYPMTLTRDEVGSGFNTITNVRLEITGRETGNWAGQYGPYVDYASVFAVPLEVTEPEPILPRVGMGSPFVFPMTVRGRSFGSWVTR